jgi:hypothetical protein
MSKKKLTPKGPAPVFKAQTQEALIYGKKHYMLMGLGLGLVILGMLLMLGGGMPDPDTWDESLIYSHRRITFAPLLIVAGLVVEVYAIFLKEKVQND